jgi:hypothetical protein
MPRLPGKLAMLVRSPKLKRPCAKLISCQNTDILPFSPLGKNLAYIFSAQKKNLLLFPCRKNL